MIFLILLANTAPHHAYIGNGNEQSFIRQQITGRKSVTQRATVSWHFKNFLTSFAVAWTLDCVTPFVFFVFLASDTLQIDVYACYSQGCWRGFVKQWRKVGRSEGINGVSVDCLCLRIEIYRTALGRKLLSNKLQNVGQLLHVVDESLSLSARDLIYITTDLRPVVYYLFTARAVLVCLTCVYGPVNPMGSCRARSVYVTTLLLDRVSPLSGKPVLCTFFRQKLTTALLESAEGREWP